MIALPMSEPISSPNNPPISTSCCFFSGEIVICLKDNEKEECALLPNYMRAELKYHKSLAVFLSNRDCILKRTHILCYTFRTTRATDCRVCLLNFNPNIKGIVCNSCNIGISFDRIFFNQFRRSTASMMFNAHICITNHFINIKRVCFHATIANLHEVVREIVTSLEKGCGHAVVGCLNTDTLQGSERNARTLCQLFKCHINLLLYEQNVYNHQSLDLTYLLFFLLSFCSDTVFLVVVVLHHSDHVDLDRKSEKVLH